MRLDKLLLIPAMLLFAILACVRPEGGGTSGLRGTLDRSDAEKVEQVDAVEAIQRFAQETLGLDINDLKAGGRSGAINFPVTTREGVDVAIDMAGTTYFGLWKDGFASLSVGDSTVTGDVIADIQDGSLGAYWIRSEQGVPSDAAGALDMVMTVFPGLLGFDFDQVQSEDFERQGFQFQARQAEEIHFQDWEITLTGTNITTGVAPGVRDGNSIVWAVVASGVLAGPVDK